MNNPTITNNSTGTAITLGNTLSGYSGTFQSPYYYDCSNTLSTTLTFSTINSNTIMQNKVAVFKVTRNEENKITSTEFIKELWVETKNGQTVEFEVARDKDLADYKSEDLVIKTVLSVTF